MATYRTLKADEAEKAIIQIAGLEPLVVDEKLVAIMVGPLRIYTARGEQLLVSERTDPQP